MSYNSNIMNDRKKFLEALIGILTQYRQNQRGLFGLALFSPAHLKAADKMIMEAHVAEKNLTDENWSIFAIAFKAFHEDLVEKNSTTLLPAINDFVAQSPFPHMLSIATNFNRLNELGRKLSHPETIEKPSAIYVIDDLARDLPLFTVSANNSDPVSLTAFVSIESKENDGDTIRVITEPGNKQQLYSGPTNTEDDAQNAVTAISKQLGTALPDNRFNQQLTSVIPFLTQNGILDRPIADCFSILKVCTYLDSVKDPIEDLNNAVNEFGFQPMAPTHCVNIDVGESGITVTETFLFEKYRLQVGDDAGEEHTFTTPIQAVNTFKCKIAEDGQSAAITEQTVVFSASHPEQKASLNSGPSNK